MIHISATLEAKSTPFREDLEYSFHLWRQQLRPGPRTSGTGNGRIFTALSAMPWLCLLGSWHFQTLAGSQFNFKTNRFLYCCFFKSNKKRKSMGMSWFLFQPKEQLIKMEVGCHFDGKTSIYSNLIVVQKVFGFKSPIPGGRVSTLANCYPNIFQTNIRPSRLHLQGVYFWCLNLRPFSLFFHFCFTPIKRINRFCFRAACSISGTLCTLDRRKVVLTLAIARFMNFHKTWWLKGVDLNQQNSWWECFLLRKTGWESQSCHVPSSKSYENKTFLVTESKKQEKLYTGTWYDMYLHTLFLHALISYHIIYLYIYILYIYI